MATTYKITGLGAPKTVLPMSASGTAQVQLDPITRRYLNARSTLAAAAPKTTDPYASIISAIRGTIQTPAQIRAQAQTTALTNEQAALAAQNAASQKIIDQYNGQANRAQGFARALATIQQGQDDQAFQQYSDAASRLGGLGAGLSGAVSDAYQGDVNQTQQVVDQLTGGRGQVSTPSADAIRNAQNYMGVTVPAGSLQADAVNAAALARGDAASRAQHIADIAQGYTSQANDQIAQEAADARALIAQRPASIQQIIDSLTQTRTGNVGNLVSALGSAATYKQNAAQAAEAKRQFNVQNAGQAARDYETQREFNVTSKETASRDAASAASAAASLAVQSAYLNNTLSNSAAALTGVIPGTKIPTYAASQDATQNAAKLATLALQAEKIYGYRFDPTTLQPIRDKSGNLVPITGFKLAPGGQSVIKLATPGKGGAKVAGYAGLSPSGLRTLKSDVTDRVIEGLKTSRVYDPSNKDADPKGYVASSPTQYDQALQTAIDAGPKTAKWKADATKIVNDHYPGGVNGRPSLRNPATPRGRANLLAAVQKWAQDRGQGMDYPTALDAIRSDFGTQGFRILGSNDPNYYLPSPDALQIAVYKTFYQPPPGTPEHHGPGGR